MRGGGKGRAFLRDSRGMALLITIMIISLLVVVTFEFAKTMRQNHLAAVNLKNSEQLGAIARSGLNLAVALLTEDGKASAFDSLLDDWAVVGQSDLSGLFAQGDMELQITDLSGKLQINSLIKGGGVGPRTKEILSRLLLSGDFAVEGEAQANEIVDSLVDWLDADDNESDAGAENSYYQSRSPGYSCKNGPVQFVEELLLVKGMTPFILYGGEGKKPLSQYITVYGDDGKINLGTTETGLIQAMNPLVTAELVAGLDEFRRDKGNKDSLADPAWYKTIPSWPGDILFDENLLTAKSTFFLIESTGILENQRQKIVVTVSRAEQGKITELTRKVE